MTNFVPFDAIRKHVDKVLADGKIPLCSQVNGIYLVRDLRGRVRIVVSDENEENESCQNSLLRMARTLHEVLGPHGNPPDSSVLFVDKSMLRTLRDGIVELRPGIYWVDRLLSCQDWWTVKESGRKASIKRWTLFSIKGGVGRSTTAAVLAWHLAHRGERVLLLDLDLESPGLSSALLPANKRPDLGIVDWFVEDLVDQSDQVLESMTYTPEWVRHCDGHVCVVPAHGRELGEYLAKLGRVYLDKYRDPWTARLQRLMNLLETNFEPTVVLIESRSGLHDIGAATVSDLDAQVLLFAADSPSTWTDYDILFSHWSGHRLAEKIRERLWIVSALTPELNTERYLHEFREQAWELFINRLYDHMPTSAETVGAYSFDLSDENGPHWPMVIHWTRGLAAGVSLQELERTTVGQAYTEFLKKFDQVYGFRDLGGGQ